VEPGELPPQGHQHRPLRWLDPIHQGNNRKLAEQSEHRRPAGIGYEVYSLTDDGGNGPYATAPKSYFSVWQKLSTRTCGEAVSADVF
jgi:hypothetical protein